MDRRPSKVPRLQEPRSRDRRPPKRYVSAAIRRRRAAVGLAAVLMVGLAVTGIADLVRPAPKPVRVRIGSATKPAAKGGDGTPKRPVSTTVPPSPVTTVSAPPKPGRYGVGQLELSYVEPGRYVTYPRAPGGPVTVPRTLAVEVLYPVGSRVRPKSGFPLIVFGPGYDETPTAYTPLLRSWASAGFVVAAPTFPLTSSATPGGPLNEADLVNQPADEQFLITKMIAASSTPGNALQGLVNPSAVGVAGQSDGGNTALGIGYVSAFRDPRVKAVAVLSGASYPFEDYGGWFPAGSPPLLAVQGTADTVNPPGYTNSYFSDAPQPKYLLCLEGAGHLQPYTTVNAYQQITTAVTTDFFDRWLYGAAGSLTRMLSAGTVPGLSTFSTQCLPAPAAG